MWLFFSNCCDGCEVVQSVKFVSSCLLLVGEPQAGEFGVPCVGTGDLTGWLQLAEFTILIVGQITLSPLAESVGDLFETTDWVGFVVSAEW